MTLEQLMAFSVTADQARQEQVWDNASRSGNDEPYQIRRMLTENTVRASDRRAQFVGLEAYEQASGTPATSPPSRVRTDPDDGLRRPARKLQSDELGATVGSAHGILRQHPPNLIWLVVAGSAGIVPRLAPDAPGRP